MIPKTCVAAAFEKSCSQPACRKTHLPEIHLHLPGRREEVEVTLRGDDWQVLARHALLTWQTGGRQMRAGKRSRHPAAGGLCKGSGRACTMCLLTGSRACLNNPSCEAFTGKLIPKWGKILLLHGLIGAGSWMGGGGDLAWGPPDGLFARSFVPSFIHLIQDHRIQLSVTMQCSTVLFFDTLATSHWRWLSTWNRARVGRGYIFIFI